MGWEISDILLCFAVEMKNRKKLFKRVYIMKKRTRGWGPYFAKIRKLEGVFVFWVA